MFYKISYKKRYCNKNHQYIQDFDQIISENEYDFIKCYTLIYPTISDTQTALNIYLSWFIINFTPERLDYLLNEFTYIKLLPIHLIAIAIDIDELKAYVYLVTNIIDIKPHYSIKHLQTICNIDILSYCVRPPNYLNYTFLELILYNYKSVLKNKRSILPMSILHYMAYEFNTEYTIYNYKQFNHNLICNFDYELFDSCIKINKFNIKNYSNVLIDSLEYLKWDYTFSMLRLGIDFWESFNECSLQYIPNMGVIYNINPKFIGNTPNIKWIIKNSYNEDKLKNSVYKQSIVRFQRLCMLYGFDEIAIYVNKVYNLSILSLIDCAIGFKRYKTLKRILTPKVILQIDIDHWVYYMSLCNNLNILELPSYYKTPFSSPIQIFKLLLDKCKYIIDILLRQQLIKYAQYYNVENIYGNYTNLTTISTIFDSNDLNTQTVYSRNFSILLDSIICLKQGFTILKKIKSHLRPYINTKYINEIISKCVQYSDYPTFQYIQHLYYNFTNIVLFNTTHVHKNIKNIDYLLEISFVNSDKRILEFFCRYISNNNIKTIGFRLEKCLEYAELYNNKLPFKYIMKHVDIIKSYNLISPNTNWNNIFDFMSYLNIDKYLLYKFIKSYNIICNQVSIYYYFIFNILSDDLLIDLYKNGNIQCPVFYIIKNIIYSHKLTLLNINDSLVGEVIKTLTPYYNFNDYVTSLDMNYKFLLIKSIICDNTNSSSNFYNNIKYIQANYSKLEQIIIIKDIIKSDDLHFIKQLALIKFNYYSCYDYINLYLKNVIRIYNRVHSLRILIRKRHSIKFRYHHRNMNLTIKTIKYSPPTKLLKNGSHHYQECYTKYNSKFI